MAKNKREESALPLGEVKEEVMEEPPVKRKLKCAYCPRQFADLASLVGHLRWAEDAAPPPELPAAPPEEEAPTPGVSPPEEEEQEAPSPAVPDTQCQYCGYVFTTRGNRVKHQRYRRCKILRSTEVGLTEVKQEVVTLAEVKQEVVEEEEVPSTSQGNNTTRAGYGYALTLRSDLQRHLRQVQESTAVEMAEMKEEMIPLADIKQEVEEVEQEVETEETSPNQCTGCGHVFSTPYNLLKHLRLMRCKGPRSTEAVPLVEVKEEVITLEEIKQEEAAKEIKSWCHTCGARFPSRPLLRQHLESEHHRKVFPCPRCGWWSPRLNLLQQHHKKTHGSPLQGDYGEENVGFKCGGCRQIYLSEEARDTCSAGHLSKSQQQEIVTLEEAEEGGRRTRSQIKNAAAERVAPAPHQIPPWSAGGVVWDPGFFLHMNRYKPDNY